jgi:hypothetical protein
MALARRPWPEMPASPARGNELATPAAMGGGRDQQPAAWLALPEMVPAGCAGGPFAAR